VKKKVTGARYAFDIFYFFASSSLLPIYLLNESHNEFIFIFYILGALHLSINGPFRFYL